MNKVNKRALIIFVIGFSAIILAIIITPSFASKYLDSDHDITPAGLRKLGQLRLLLVSFGILAIVIETLVDIIGLKRLRVFLDWLLGKLKDEKVLVVIILLVGSIARLYHLPIVGINSPYKSGGLFLEFAHQIASNNFLLPKNIPFYTDGGIPFAYPPLPFYIEAIAIYILGITPYGAVNILPPIVAVLSLLSFYYLVREADLTKWASITALAAFAVMPNAFLEQIEGAGLSESFGTLALIWFSIALYRAYKQNDLIYYFAIGLSWALCIVSSPGSAYSSAPIFLIFAIAVLLHQKNLLNTALRLTLAAAIALIISSPYWLTVINNHGVGLFLDSIGGQYSGHRNPLFSSIEILLKFKLISGPYPNIWNYLVLIGGVVSFLKRRFGLLLSFMVLVIIPGEGSWMLSIPSALLIGISIEPTILFLKNELLIRETKIDDVIVNIGIFFMILWILIGPITAVRNGPFSEDSRLDPKIVEAMNWMQMNTNPNSNVVVLSEWHVLDWFPHITRRTVINIPFGSEWQPDEDKSIKEFNKMVPSCGSTDCILSLSKMIVDKDQYILFINKEDLNELEKDQTNDKSFDLLWENELIAIGELSKQ